MGNSDKDRIILAAAEELIEDDPTLPGKYVPVNDGDADGDGIVDFADWEYASATNNRFVPIEVTIASTASANATVTFRYDASDPSQVTEDEASGTWQLPAAGHLRLWKHGGNEPARQPPPPPATISLPTRPIASLTSAGHPAQPILSTSRA